MIKWQNNKEISKKYNTTKKNLGRREKKVLMSERYYFIYVILYWTLQTIIYNFYIFLLLLCFCRLNVWNVFFLKITETIFNIHILMITHYYKKGLTSIYNF